MGVKLVSAVLMVALVLGGFLAPVAGAQEKTAGQMGPAAEKGDAAWQFATGVVNMVHVPGKAVLCGVGAATGVALLVLTFGSGYQMAGRVWDEGCAGRWTVTADDLKPKERESDFWSERPGYRQ
ncbi:MAG: hypothetical protein HY725_19425 [Candidatus Rokubacteria bacterium]|nr:hypothetical protein [Candidatus Rokubacteria bacterium]